MCPNVVSRVGADLRWERELPFVRGRGGGGEHEDAVQLLVLQPRRALEDDLCLNLHRGF